MKKITTELLIHEIMKFGFDQIYCSNDYIPIIEKESIVFYQGSLFVDNGLSYNYDKMYYIKINNKKIDIIIDNNLDCIMLKHSTLKNERKYKLKNLY